MLGSKNNTFYKSNEYLNGLYSNMNLLLFLKGRNEKDIKDYQNAFQYFQRFPFKFDGATIVKDLNDLPNLDLDAMLHDYEYLKGANKDFVKKWYCDIRYIKNMEKNGKGIRVVRFILLSLIGLIFVPYCKILK